MKKAIDKYKDIIDLPHHEPKNFPRMSMYERSAQFSVFDAVTGHSDAIEECARFVEDMIEISEDAQKENDMALTVILSKIKTKPLVSVKYFMLDELKEGGKYLFYTGNLKRFDDINRILEFVDGEKISLNFVVEIKELSF